MYDPCDAYSHWKDMPKCDVLITHSPPFGILDSVGNMPLGEQDLMNAVYRTQPQYHVFGHLHDPHGGERYRKWEDGSGTVFANVCRVGENYKPVADPVYTFEV